jgi:hypothetical protein
MKSPVLFTALAACTAIIATPTVANAESITRLDKIHDVVRFPDDPEGVRAPRNARADIVWSKMGYANDNVSVALKIRSLRPRGSNNTVMRVRTSDGSTYLALIGVQDGETPTVEVFRGGSTVTCTDVVVKFKPVKDRVSVDIPANCVGSPDWVRVGAVQNWSAAPGGDVFSDDARLGGKPRTAAPPVLGPQLDPN